MKYMLMICVDEALEVSPEESDVEPWLAEMSRRGIWLQGEELRGVETARTVRVRGGQIVVSDGPFAETKEQMAGYDLIECASLDEALEVAAKHPVAKFGSVEVRPFTAQ